MAEASSCSSVRRTKFEVPRVPTQAFRAGIVQKSKIFITNRESRGYHLTWHLSLGPGFAATLELTHCNNSDLELHATCYWWLEGRGVHCIAINDGFDANAEMPVARSVQMEDPRFSDEENHYGYFIVEIFVDERIESSKQLYQDLLHIYEFQSCTAMTVVTDHRKFPVHRLILSAASPVFADMLRRTRQRENIILELHDLKPHILKQLLSFIYTGKSPDDTYEQWPRLLMAAKRFGMDDLKAVCVDAIIRTRDLNPDALEQQLLCFICMDTPSYNQWPRLLVVSDSFGMDDLKEICVDVMTRSLSRRNAEDYLAVAIIASALQLKQLALNLIRLRKTRRPHAAVDILMSDDQIRRMLLNAMLGSNWEAANEAARVFYDMFIR